MVITRAYINETTEIVVCETDRLAILIKRNGCCVTRISISPEALSAPFSELRIETKTEQPNA